MNWLCGFLQVASLLLLLLAMQSGAQEYQEEDWITMDYGQINHWFDDLPVEHVVTKRKREASERRLYYDPDTKIVVPMRVVTEETTTLSPDWEVAAEVKPAVVAIHRPFEEMASTPKSRYEENSKLEAGSTHKPDYEEFPKPAPGSTSKPVYEESTSKPLESSVEPSVKSTPSAGEEIPDRISATQMTEVSEDEWPMLVGSIRGIPGMHFPNYYDIPLTSFNCADRKFIPGFYADLETGCQVFHVCWHHRRESFLCPVGTTFNQAILACDYWYSSNCSVASHYYNVNAPTSTKTEEASSESHVGSMIDSLLEHGHSEEISPPTTSTKTSSATSPSEPSKPDLSFLMQFLPVKAKVVVYPESKLTDSKIVAEASVGSKPRKSKPVKFILKEPSVIHQKDKEAVPFHGGIDPSVGKIIDDVFDIAKQIVKEAGEFVPRKIAVGNLREIPTPERKPLTKLNPRFITKAIPFIEKTVKVVPVQKAEKTVLKTLSTKKTAQLKPEPVFVAEKTIHKPLLFPSKALNFQLKLSPVTKKTLTENYLKFWKLKHK